MKATAASCVVFALTPFCGHLLGVLLPGASSDAVAFAAEVGRASAPYVSRIGYGPILAQADLVYAEMLVEKTDLGGYHCPTFPK